MKNFNSQKIKTKLDVILEDEHVDDGFAEIKRHPIVDDEWLWVVVEKQQQQLELNFEYDDDDDDVVQ